MTALVLRLLGAFEARDAAGHAFPVKSRKGRALVAALALEPGHSLPRERLCSLLWGDRGDDQARSSLRQVLVGLRRDFAAFAAPLLLVSDTHLAIDPAHIEVDAI